MDDELERLLREYRVSDPPAQLRDQIVAQASLGLPTREEREGGRRADRYSIVEWLPAAAALASALVFSTLAQREYQLAAQPTRDLVRERLVRDLTGMLGDETLARAEADRAIAAHEQRAAAEQAPNDLMPVEREWR